MSDQPLPTRPEPTTRDGEILLSPNHIALLHGLYDRPDGYAESQAEWVRASLPHIARFRKYPCGRALRLAMRTVHPSWATQSRRGRRIEVRLTPRGRSILERELPTRIRGIGEYEGLESVTFAHWPASSIDAEPHISDDGIRKALAYQQAFGIPLLPLGSTRPNAETLFAVTQGLGRGFTLKSREELTLFGPRRAHAVWARLAVECGDIPEGYRAAFEGYDEEDLLCYLQEQRRKNEDQDQYCQTYAGRTFLSEAKLQEWLSEVIDFTQTDIPQCDLVGVAIDSSATYRKANQVIKESELLAWAHPDTGRSVGRAFSRLADPYGNRDLFVTSCAALTCLQVHFDVLGLGILIETRYLDAGLP